MPSVPRNEIIARIEALQSSLTDYGFSSALIVQRADLFYFSGTGQDAHLFVPAAGAAQLFVRRNYDRALADSPLESILPIKSLGEIGALIKAALGGHPECLGMELDVLPVNNYRLYEELFPDAAIRDVSTLIKHVRMVKSDYELQIVKRAAALNDSMFCTVQEFLKEGMAEIELAGLIEAFYRKHGHQGYVRVRSFNQEVFYGHVMSGSNLAVPSCSVGPTGGPGPHASLPQGCGFKRIGKHEPVQIDYVAIVDGYIVDQARTFYLDEPPEKFRTMHETALAIQNTLAEQGTAGTRAEELYDTAIRMAEEAGFLDGFLGYPQPVPFVGHGIGLELDEFPLIGRKSPHILQKGMVVALEPKFIVPGEGLAGIENSFLVTDNGMEKLTLFDDSIQVID
ncbi:MAG TPA: Xaa-Pro peptidase family protein [Desulfomonilaceae bacterium]|nr:Xaa-Pro peptidase family protein [Desulfomonilaceae bacterium]